MASSLARRVEHAIARRALWTDADRVAVAISGGADSVALALVLAELERAGRWRLAGLIHVNHGLRGPESDADEAFCRALANRLGLPIDVTRADTRALLAAGRRSIESAARELRYAAFERASDRLGATVVATAHTSDNQAETVLLRLLRGAATRGVAAIRPRRGRYRRPLLECRRAEVRRYLARRGEPFREDASNQDVAIPRNRLRHVLMPVLEELWPGGVPALGRFAEVAGDDERWLTALATRAGARCARRGPDGVELDREGLSRLPAPLARRVVREAVEAAGGRPSFRDVEAVRRLASGTRPSGRLTLGAVVAERAAAVVRIGARRPAPVPPGFAYALSLPGAVRVDETGVAIRASLLTAAECPVSTRAGEAVVALQASRLVWPLQVRSRRPGDRMRPLGAPGSRKLQDLLIDRKVPRADRDGIPIVTDAEGRIVWVAGVAIAHDWRVTNPAAGMVILKMAKGNQ